MEIGEILKKMGRATLTTAEQEALRLWGNDMQTKSALIADLVSGNYNPKFNSIQCNTLFSSVSPSFSPYIVATGNGRQNIPDSAWTNISLIIGNPKNFVYNTSADLTLIRIKREYADSSRCILLTGFAEWESNATGIRRIAVETEWLGLTSYVSVSDTTAVSGSITGQSFSFVSLILPWLVSGGTTYEMGFRIKVYQNSSSTIYIQPKLTALLIK